VAVLESDPDTWAGIWERPLGGFRWAPALFIGPSKSHHLSLTVSFELFPKGGVLVL